MISNERQYKITRRQLERLREAIADIEEGQDTGQASADPLASAELAALRSEEKVLLTQIQEYEDLKSGAVRKLVASSLEELPRVLIQARIVNRLSQRELAERIGVKEQQIQRYEANEYSSVSLRRLLEIADALDLNVAEMSLSTQRASSEVADEAEELDWSRFPVREMYRRQWFESFKGSLDDAIQNGGILARDYVQSVFRRPAAAFHRRSVRAGAMVDHYALMAWECRILRLGVKAELKGQFRVRTLDTRWFFELARQSAEDDGPRRAIEVLKEAGIALVVEPHLAKTYLDGAAFLYAGRPIIGMTLRYDRLDNFWFVLFHELAHVAKHLRRGKILRIFDDLEAAPTKELELEADRVAADSLIPSSKWELSLARYLQSSDLVKDFATELAIDPAIVAGRIRNESNNFVILSDLVGQGQVRKHFPEVEFGA